MTNVTLVGYHFPKTGGTSIHAHAVLHLGELHHYSFGHYNDARLAKRHCIVRAFQ